MEATVTDVEEKSVDRADDLYRQGQWAEALEVYQDWASSSEIPSPELCVKIARCHLKQGREEEAFKYLTTVVDAGDDYSFWQSAAQLLPQDIDASYPGIQRTATLALLGSSTTAHFVPVLRLAAARYGVALEIFEGNYGQYRQELLDPESQTYAADPDFILLAVDNHVLGLPNFSSSPQESIDDELSNWTSLWGHASEKSDARIIQFNFPVPPEEPMGHLATRLSGARSRMIRELNLQLGDEAGDDVLLVDCERLASTFGKQRWSDPRYWHLAKEAVALDALPLLAKHTASVVAAALGLSRKCLVLDLDNTLWGGVIGEDGLSGIKLGQGGQGEAFVAFQEYILRLKEKGVIVAVCSKNNEKDARQPFEEHPEMRLVLDDIAMFVANWQPKPDNLREIAQTLNIGLDSLVFADDNPAEREVVRQLVPEVDVITLPDDPAYYVRALSEYPMFETSTFTEEDAKKTEQYQARAKSIQLKKSVGSLDEFYEDLQMKAVVAPFDDFHLPRIVQLLGKSNQFNLTTRRHDLPKVRAFMNDPEAVTFYLRLQDRFADHGLVSLMIAERKGDALDIDSWLMSCRVIGRTVESLMLSHLCQKAHEMECTKLRGTYIPTDKNQLVEDIYPKYGFESVGEEGGTTFWVYDLGEQGDITNSHIEVVTELEHA